MNFFAFIMMILAILASLFGFHDTPTGDVIIDLPAGPELNDPCDPNNDLCVAPYTCQFDPDPFAVDSYTCQP